MRFERDFFGFRAERRVEGFEKAWDPEGLQVT